MQRGLLETVNRMHVLAPVYQQLRLFDVSVLDRLEQRHRAFITTEMRVVINAIFIAASARPSSSRTARSRSRRRGS